MDSPNWDFSSSSGGVSTYKATSLMQGVEDKSPQASLVGLPKGTDPSRGIANTAPVSLVAKSPWYLG